MNCGYCIPIVGGLSFALIVICPVHTRAQTVEQAWVGRYSAASATDDKATAIAVDANGTVFVTGYSSSTPRISDRTTTIAYSRAGIALWTNQFSGFAGINTYPTAITTDGNGNVLVTGYSASTNAAPYNYDCVTIKYSGSGVPLWTNRYSGAAGGNDYATAIGADANGDVVVAGYSAGATGWPFDHDFLTMKYSEEGQPLWTNRYAGPADGDDQASAIAVDPGGNVFVTGSSGDEGGFTDYATIAYSGSGVPLWTNRYGGPGNGIDNATAIAVDGTGDVIVGGSSAGANVFPYHYGYLTLKYSNSGAALWTNRYNGPGGSDYETAIAVRGGDVFVTGRSVGNHYDFATVKYSSAGVPLWTNRYDGPGMSDDSPLAAVVDDQGNLIVSGYSYGGGGVGYDYLTIGYAPTGAVLWSNRYNGPGNSADQAAAMAVDHNGNVFVTGWESRVGGGSAYATVRYALSVPLAIAEADNLAVLTWTKAAFGWTNLSFSLQSAPTVTGPFTNIPSATSPYSNRIGGAQQYFRLIAE